MITISRLPGSGADRPAKQLSEDLNIDLFDNEIVEEIVKSAHVSEAVIATLDEQDRSMLDDWVGAIEKKATSGPMKIFLILQKLSAP